jgi:hypothetical protein
MFIVRWHSDAGEGWQRVSGDLEASALVVIKELDGATGITVEVCYD